MQAISLRSRVAGLILGVAMVFGRVPLKNYGGKLICAVSNFLVDQLEWFQTARPMGVKLHFGLSNAYSVFGLQYLSYVSNVFSYLEHLGTFDIITWLVVLVSFVLGLEYGLQAVSLCITLFLTPLAVLNFLASHMVSLHLMISNRLWQAIRGKSRPFEIFQFFQGSVHGVSGYELTFACLLFMPAILTLPTTLWYGIFVQFVYYIIYQCFQLILQGLLKIERQCLFPGAPKHLFTPKDECKQTDKIG